MPLPDVVEGSNADRPFRGKIISATNRDLADEMRARRFREDFYYRLCADQIPTPSLQEQLADRPEDLSLFVAFVSRTVVGEEKAVALAREIVCWIENELPGYTWPGNFRELEQCVRSYTLRRKYRPLRLQAAERPSQGTGDPLVRARPWPRPYCTNGRPTTRSNANCSPWCARAPPPPRRQPTCWGAIRAL